MECRLSSNRLLSLQSTFLEDGQLTVVAQEELHLWTLLMISYSNSIRIVLNRVSLGNSYTKPLETWTLWATALEMAMSMVIVINLWRLIFKPLLLMLPRNLSHLQSREKLRFQVSLIWPRSMSLTKKLTIPIKMTTWPSQLKMFCRQIPQHSLKGKWTNSKPRKKLQLWAPILNDYRKLIWRN